MTFFLPKPPQYHPLRRSVIALLICVIVMIVGLTVPVIRHLLADEGTPAEPDSFRVQVVQFLDDYDTVRGGVVGLSGLAVYVLTVRWIDNAVSNLEVLRPGSPRWLLRIIPVIAFVPVLNVLGSFFYFSYLYRKSDPRQQTESAQYIFDTSIYIRCFAMIALWFLLISWVKAGSRGATSNAEIWLPVILILTAIAGCLLSIVFQVTWLQQKFRAKLSSKMKRKVCDSCGEEYPTELHACPVCGVKTLSAGKME